ncbi:hypothetical protein GCM10011504_21400 [Siccirubricoccus deserti]|uniref:Uncharacterized protein n=1 Tax=Siccirubricoccus deserti TaxID=2013562 RepID=A0A9X0QZ32_9PROT|nr:hypothetical protein [Siccirubricoccus deserti]MBC4015558.1 hypothetical protein [Siccirubricoccus deserti]GGC42674.1 hypothetical protein GCM10011504_21400 [Siccirubricoccus deserti]
MFLPSCNPLAMAGTAMGGMAVLAGIGPFLAGVGVGAGIVGGACLARQAMRKRSEWREDHGNVAAADVAAADTLPDEGEPLPGANPI